MANDRGHGLSAGRWAAAGIAVAAVVALVAVVWRPTWLGFSHGTQLPDGSAPAHVDVLCDADLALSVSGEVVAATAAGVAVQVTSEAPAGAYLNYAWSGGGGGGGTPNAAQTWMLAAPPGKLRLSCSTLDREGAEVVVDVVDPHEYWSDLTLADLGCPLGGMPSWAVSAGTGETAQEAVDDLISKFEDVGTSPAVTRAEHAEIGYPDAPTQTWILGNAGTTYMTAMVTDTGSGYTADPDALCRPSPWATELSSS